MGEKKPKRVNDYHGTVWKNVDGRKITLTSNKGRKDEDFLTKDHQRLLYDTVYFAKKK
ncbi:hypothetical protein [Levilactobacillus brevis]|uniref:hypothetical protein n=1 Tax=Levilactobacillus brevis TaxID=1580 RepID=UPI0012F4F2EB|nr:hypothetical protein [Levilactobacillus brevis]